MKKYYEGYDDWDNLMAEECTSRDECIAKTEEAMNDYLTGEVICGNIPKQSFDYKVYICCGDECEEVELEFIWE